MFTKTLLTFVVFALIASFAAARQNKEQGTAFACNIGTLSADQRKDLSAAIHRLIDAKPATKELANGYEMRFANGGELFTTATTWIQYERLCCPFFDFSIQLTKNGGPMTIRLTGPK